MHVLVYNVAPAKVDALVSEWHRRQREGGAPLLVLHVPSEHYQGLKLLAPNTVVNYCLDKSALAAYVQAHNIYMVWCGNPSALPTLSGECAILDVKHTRRCINETFARASLNRQRLFVSLGKRCNTAYNLNKYAQPRTAAYPFDWLGSCFESVLAVCALSNFDDLFNRENLVADTERYRDEGELTITLKPMDARGLYLRFRHDFKIAEYVGNEEEKHAEFLEKYRRRCDRLRQAIYDSATGPEVVFVRIDDNLSDLCDEQYVRFQNTMRTIHPKVRYRLVVLTCNPAEVAMSPTIRDTHIHLHLGPTYATPLVKDPIWTMPHYDWDAIYRDVKALL